MNLVNHLADRAIQHPDRIALIDSTQSLSYAELYTHVCVGSKKLQDDGLGPGDPILILQPVTIPLYISLLSAFHAGLTVIFIDPSAGKSVIRNSLSLYPPKALIGAGKAHLLRLTIPEIRNIPKLYHSSGWAANSSFWSPTPTPTTTTPPPHPSSPESPALVTFTSGSTGMPKAACRSHGFLLAQHQALAESLDYHEGEVDLITLPVFTLANLASGLTSVLADTDLRFPIRTESPAILRQCQQHQITRCAASPAFFEKLHRDNSFPNFHTIYTGGAPVFPDLLAQIQTAHPALKIVTVYGSTEAEPISHNLWSSTSADELQMMVNGRGLLVGKPVCATQLRIISDHSGENIPPMSPSDFDALQLKDQKIGEIIVTGDHVLQGYLNGQGDEENKIKVIPSDTPDDPTNSTTTIWHRTGDAGWLDPLGRVWLVGRCSAAIKRPGKEPVYPFGIECAAMHHPAVTRCALIDHQGKNTLVLQNSPKQPITPAEQQEIKESLSSLPIEQFLYLEHIPVDNRHNAKINYPALSQLLLSHR